MPSRRTFLAATAVAAVPASAPAAPGPDAVSIAVMGCGGMGTNHLRLLAQNPRVRITHVCDADANRLAAAAKIATDAGHPGTPVKDIRRVLDDRGVVAVWMATPDHWHTPGAILAADAGKHVYVEKPCSHNVREGRLLADAAARNKVVIQVGTQARSTPTVKAAMDRLKGGAIGDVLACKAWNSQLRRNLGKVQPSKPPEGLDYELWQGPAPEAPFYSNRVPGMWRFFKDYGAGDIGNDGVHNIDVAVWGMGFDRLPNRVAALGSKAFFDDDQEWPDTQYVVCEYDPGNGGRTRRQFTFEQRIWSPYVQEGYENGNAFYGTKGVLIIGHTIGWKLYGERNRLIEEMTGSVNLPAHHNNFLDAATRGAAANAPAAVGHVSAGICHLANIAVQLRATIEFDPAKEAVLNNPAAQSMLSRRYRDGHWAVPRGVTG